MKKLFILILSALSLTACSDDNKGENHSEIELEETAFSLVRGDSRLVWISGGDGDYSATCADPQVAAVQIQMTNLGPAILVRGQKEGNTVITVSDENGNTASCVATVLSGKIQLLHLNLDIALNSTNRTPIIGGSLKFKAEISDPEIAEVAIENSGGEYLLRIESKKTGQAIITVTDTERGDQAQLSVGVKKLGLHVIETRIAVDAEKKEAIEKELNENPPFPLNSIMILEKDYYAVFAPDETEIVRGTCSHEQKPAAEMTSYGIRIEEQVQAWFRFNAVTEGREHSYDVIIVYRQGPTFYFCEDLTAECRMRFLDAGIKRVGRAVVFRNGWIDE